ncbi:MAG TPA: hypothetical protein PLI83_02255 [Thermomonas sp.]|jgi:hypothetical protein|uniref:hypothetical protein n=1 Tax=Thermomonas sp. TaxID=1971895 RepID=UPI002CE0317C|nr:hypothetical protein [Thermomonas sp.]HOZ23588.1 hypothetical protein [Thermomonas sp.]HPW13634.1 hypothetical protein [Thermomonas sp.]
MMELTPAQRAIRRRNRNMLVGLFVLFFGGMLVAGLLRFSGWRPEGSKNKGELLQPYGDLRAYTPTLANGGAYGWKDEPRIWRIVAMPRDCATSRAAECKRLLADFDKVWRLMSKDADRVHVLWAGDLPPGVAVPREVRQLRADDGLRAGLARWDDASGDAAWLVDPNGFVVLRYAPGFDPGDLRSDLARLLKIN